MTSSSRNCQFSRSFCTLACSVSGSAAIKSNDRTFPSKPTPPAQKPPIDTSLPLPQQDPEELSEAGVTFSAQRARVVTTDSAPALVLAQFGGCVSRILDDYIPTD
jgi:hypothetical protein